MIKNTASQTVSAQLVAVADGEDVTTGTTTVYVTGDNGTQSTGSGTVAHKGNGCWSYVPTQAETNYNHVSYTFVNTAAVSVTVQRDPVTLADYKATGFATVASILTTQMTESYAADGTAPTLAQALFLIQQALTEFAYSGTTNTVKKLDGSTTAATFTLDDATDPTSQTRAT